MKDFFKELNIIDILGIGVPGCLLVLLLGGDQTAELLWMEQFQYHPLAFGIVLIVVGSLAGMLIQELGDLIEKGLWMISWLDPKTYAAFVVNTDSLDIETLEKKKYSNSKETAHPWIRWVCVAAAALVIICASVLLPFAMWRSAVVSTTGAKAGAGAWLGVMPLLGGGVAVYLLRRRLPETDSVEGKKLFTIRNANPYIQTLFVDHGNTSKRTLYDGWRFVMRNLVLVLAVTNLISLWKPLDLYRRVADFMVGPDGNMTVNLFFLMLFSSVSITLMLVRYYHYAYLRYKYSLEDYIQLIEEAKKQKKEAEIPAGT